MGSSDQWSRRRVRDPGQPAASLAPAVTVYLSVLAWRDDRGRHLALTAGRVDQDPAPVIAAPVVPVPQVGDRWQRHRPPPLPSEREPSRSAGREISYDVARYLALDTLSAMGGLAGFSIAGPPGMVAGFLVTAVARGVVSGTIGVIRARAMHRDGMPTVERRDGYRAPGPARQQRTGRRSVRSDAVRRARDERRRSAEGPLHGR